MRDQISINHNCNELVKITTTVIIASANKLMVAYTQANQKKSAKITI